jgi:hypothetical protein
LHVAFGSSEVDTPTQLEIQALDGAGAGAAVRADLADGDEAAWTIAPGRYRVACDREASGDMTVSFELVDPADHYAPTQLACGTVPQTSFASDVPTSDPHDLVIGELLWGLAPDDRIRGAGYAADTWRLGPTYIVEREGEAVARVVLGEQGGVWSGTFETCDGSGVTLSDRIVTTGGGGTGPSAGTGSGATGSTGVAQPGDVADSLVVRCEGLGPAVDRSTVRLGADGLDVEATNVADAEVVLIEDDEGNVVGEPVPFTEVTERFHVALEPGAYWVGCRVPNEQGEIDGSHVGSAGGYVGFEVLAAD